MECPGGPDSWIPMEEKTPPPLQNMCCCPRVSLCQTSQTRSQEQKDSCQNGEGKAEIWV